MNFRLSRPLKRVLSTTHCSTFGSYFLRLFELTTLHGHCYCCWIMCLSLSLRSDRPWEAQAIQASWDRQLWHPWYVGQQSGAASGAGVIHRARQAHPQDLSPLSGSLHIAGAQILQWGPPCCSRDQTQPSLLCSLWWTWWFWVCWILQWTHAGSPTVLDRERGEGPPEGAWCSLPWSQQLFCQVLGHKWRRYANHLLPVNM